MVERKAQTELTQEQVDQDKQNCEWFDSETGSCEWYKEECFHDVVVECKKVRPLTEDEMMPWMGAICSDCNESVCNYCDVYLNDVFPIELYTSLSKLKEK